MALGRDENGINLTLREKRSIMGRIVVKPSEGGRSVTKSKAKCDHGRAGTGNCMSLPAGNVLGVLH